MANNADLLVELGTEELPPTALTRLATAFAAEMEVELAGADLQHAGIDWFATPRRLAVLVSGLAEKQPDRETVRRGPALTAAYDAQGKPTKAAEGFAKSCGVAADALETLENDQGAWLVFRRSEPGKPAAELLQAMINDALRRLPIPKRMRWGAHDAEFVRPVHWLLVLFGSEVIPCTVLEQTAGAVSYGHRFHHPGPLTIAAPAVYVQHLRDAGRVLVDFNARRDIIEQAVTAAAADAGGRALMPPPLLDEVTALVEWPTAVTGNFDAAFLALPREVLIASMQDNQKYFPVIKDNDDTLLPVFIAIANIESREPEQVKRGNERVIRPRLADAAFFWKRDREQPLADYRPQLAGIVFQKELGSLLDKVTRIESLCRFMAEQLGQDTAVATRAAQLCKCDLVTDMVAEFPELQGVMGCHYAGASGEPEAVAVAIAEHYLPRGAGDRLPGSDGGRVLAMADKLDTLLGIFAVGQTPSGEKDPFGLRRAALGTLRILIECRLDLDLEACLRSGAQGLPPETNAENIVEPVFAFMMERLRRYYLDTGVRSEVFESVFVRRPTRPYDFHLRIQAVQEFTTLAEAQSLAAANKRIANILKQAEDIEVTAIDPARLETGAERALAEALQAAAEQVRPLLKRNQYSGALTLLAGLRDVVDAFFDGVMVLCEDEGLRNNRIAILRELYALFLAIADISRLPV